MKKSLFVFSLVPGVLAAANLLPNGDFESDSGWKIWGHNRTVNTKEAMICQAEAARSGKRGMLIQDKWEKSHPYIISYVPAVPDAPGYRFRFWVKAEKTQTFRAGIVQLGEKDGKEFNLNWKEQEFTAGTEWKEYAMTAPAKTGAKQIAVLIGAAGKADSSTGTIMADDAVLEVAEPVITDPLTIKLAPLAKNAQFDPARVEKTQDGFRLKNGVKSRIGDPQAAPDVTTQVKVPLDGYYRFSIGAAGTPMDAFARLSIPGFPPTLVKMMRSSSLSGRTRDIGVYPLKKGMQTIGVTLPDKLAMTTLQIRWDGPRPLPKEMTGYKAPFTPVAARPRVMLTPERAALLRKNMDHPELREPLSNLQRQAKTPLKFKLRPGVEVVCNGDLHNALKARALFAVLNSDRAEMRACAKMMHDYFTHLTGFSGANYIYDIHHAIYAAAFVYDWCYAEFTPAERKAMIGAFYRLGARQECSWPPMRQVMHTGHGNELAPALLAFAIACYNEDPEPYRIMTYMMNERLVPQRVYEYRSPAHGQGTSYGSKRLGSDYEIAALYRTGCGRDLFDRNFYRVPFYWLMLRQPDGFWFDEGDYWGLTRPPEMLETCLLIAVAAQHDPAFKDFYLAFGGPKKIPLMHVLFHDIATPANLPYWNNLPQSFCFGPFHGSMIARTGFSGDEAIAYFMGGSKHPGNHRHADAGAFQIFYRGLIAADIGDYASSYGIPYDLNFNKRSLSHNMLRVYDPAEKFGRQDNDGGSRDFRNMPDKVSLYENNPMFDYGTNRSVSIGPDKLRPAYSVLAADLTKAYSAKIRHYMRLFVFLNQGESERPASFIVCDLCESAKAEFPKFFQVSSFAPPVLKPGYIGLASEKDGRADMHIYLPKEHKVTDFADKRAAYNPLAKKQYKMPLPDSPALHAHRIEITPETAQKFDTFLTHFGIRAADAPEIAQGYTDLGNAHGIRSGKFFVTLPKRDELIRSAITMTLPEGGAQVLCVYLAPGKWHAAGRNFTVKDGENTLFLAAPAGKLVVEPGELAGAPAYQIPAECTPPAQTVNSGIFLNGKRLAETPVFEAGAAWLPANAFKGLPEFRAGEKKLMLNGVEITLNDAPRMIGGKLYVPAAILAASLHAEVQTDAFRHTVKLTSLPDNVPAIAEVRCLIAPEALAAVAGGSSSHASWQATGKFDFTLVFDRPAVVGSFMVTYYYGAVRNFPVKIELSQDGKEFHPVLEGKSTPGQKISIFRWKPEPARYLRFHGCGSNVNHWTLLEKIGFPQ